MFACLVSAWDAASAWPSRLARETASPCLGSIKMHRHAAPGRRSLHYRIRAILQGLHSGRELAFKMTDIEKNDASHIAHVDIAGIAADDKNSINNKVIVNAAEDRNEFDHKLTIKDAVKYYKWAIIWCLTISMTVVMEGYDT